MTVTIINTQTTSTTRELVAGQAGAILAGEVVNYTGTSTAIASIGNPPRFSGARP